MPSFFLFGMEYAVPSMTWSYEPDRGDHGMKKGGYKYRIGNQVDKCYFWWNGINYIATRNLSVSIMFSMRKRG